MTVDGGAESKRFPRPSLLPPRHPITHYISIILSKLVITGPTIVKQPSEIIHRSTFPSDGFVAGGKGTGNPHNILRNSETNIPVSFAEVASDKKLSERSTLRRRRITRSPSYYFIPRLHRFLTRVIPLIRPYFPPPLHDCFIVDDLDQF
ncbi:hypothetical protein IAS59_004511 [Cryptococcus gattii]